MKPEHLLFPPFRLDPVEERLWHDSHLLPLRPKAFAVLRYLVEHPQRLVTRAELLQAIWPGTYVSEGLLRDYIRNLRRVLGDDAEVPRFIETVARRGYRFIGAVVSSQLSVVSEEKLAVTGQPLVTGNWQLATRLVGRETELEQLYSWLEKALGSERQVVFVTGEPGIGKTTVVETFLARVSVNDDLWIGRGQCVEHYGAGEAYLPVLEALGRLCRGPGGERLIGLLGRHAPTWLVQMPALIDDAELEALQRKVQGATRERMLREMAEAVEVLTAERGLILWLEDLQWSDYSTLDLIASLAQRREPARLLLIGTYRPADVVVSGHPLKAVKQELQVHGQCEEVALRFLTAAEVTQYLSARFAVGAHGRAPLQELGRVIHQSTEGNPLFMVNGVDYLVAQEVIREVAGQWQLQASVEDVTSRVPESLRQLIEKQVERLPIEEQRVLEAASVAGGEFSAVAVAMGLEEKVERIEEWCEGMVRRGQLLQSHGMETLPDKTVTGRYGFSHALYQKVLYERLAASRRLRLHRRIGEGGEVVYGSRVGEIAAELAIHFERGQDYGRAVQYLQQAGERAIQRYAPREAIDYLTKGLELLQTLPDTPERTNQELRLQIPLGASLIATKGYAAVEVEKAYARARELCQQLGETPHIFSVLHGLYRFYLVRTELQTARELAEQILRLAQSAQDPALLLEAHFALGNTLLFLGEFAPAQAHLEEGTALYNPQQHRVHAFRVVQDPGVACLSYAALALWFLGSPDQALKRSDKALTLARELSHPFSLAFALDLAAWLHQCCRDGQATQKRAEELVTLANEQGFPYWSAMGTTLRAWALAEQGQGEEGIAQMRQGMAAGRATGAELGQPYYLALLAAACGKGGQAKEGLTVLAEALAAVNNSGERWWETEMYRLKGELLLAQEGKRQRAKGKTEKEAEACFHQAVDIARRQGAKSLELRAVMSLSRLWQRQGKKEEARLLLAEVYGWFTEGFDTADLQEARALLQELAG